MESKETKKWRTDQALRRYSLIMPLIDPDIDDGKRSQLRDQIAEREGIS